jgi:DNA repair protein RecN (Recombination protein N)
MLHELRIENLLLMERAELRLASGLNVVTGETGAGKTLLAHSLDLLLGGRARNGIVRDGAAEAYVEGVFSRPAGLPEEIAERLPDDSPEIVLARRVWPDGRTRAYVCGRSATVADLRELGGRLLAFYGQHEHRRLMLGSAQLEILDALGRDPVARLRALVAERSAHLRGLRSRAEELRALAGARERELDLLRYELEEIEAADPSVEEEQGLLAERERLRHEELLRAAAAGAAEVLAPGEGAGAVELLAGAAGEIAHAAGVDPALSPLAERLQALRYESEDLAGELRVYLEGIESAPGRLEQVEERLAEFARLGRKHGGGVAEVLVHAERCRARRSELDAAEGALESIDGELGAAEGAYDEAAAELSEHRRRAATELEAAMVERLSELAMPDARFSVRLAARAEGGGARGVDTVEFLLAPNAGLPEGPLREIASGGELSRVMLALLSVAHGSAAPAAAGGGDQPLLVFDEIDAGIGGHTARAVGAQLQALAAGRQILCITHLPQVAALGARHFTIAKQRNGALARTTVTALDGDELVGELVRMLGAGAGDRAASQHARQLLRAA